MKAKFLSMGIALALAMITTCSTSFAQTYYYSGGYQDVYYDHGPVYIQGGAVSGGRPWNQGSVYNSQPVIHYTSGQGNGQFGNVHYPPMHSGPIYHGSQGGMKFQHQQIHQSHQSAGVHFDRPKLGVAGAILMGVGAGLQAADPDKNKAAGGILAGVGNGMVIGSGLTVWHNKSNMSSNSGVIQWGW